MKIVAIAAAVLTLAGCESMRTVAPNTTAGFEAGGVLGALDGASGAVLARCRTLDGQVVRVAVDDLALGTGTTDRLDDIRARRQQACALIGAVQVIADGGAAPEGAATEGTVTVHGASDEALPEG